MKKIIKNPLFLSFFLCLVLGACIIIPNIIVGGGIYHIIADLDFQDIPFQQLMNDSLKNGNVYYTWFNDLGSNFIGTYSFYNIFSPFTLLGLLFPSNWYPYLVGPIFILKYGVAGLTSCLFIKRYVKNPKYAVIGSLLYAFSGFQLTNVLFFHFHDVVAFFPLLLYSLDKFMLDDERKIFPLVVFLLAITNWFFFIAEGVFFILFFLIRVICKDYEFNIKKILILLFEGILGIVMASFVLIPTMYFMISNPRIGYNWTIIEALKYPFTIYLELVRAFLLPADSMANRSFLDIANYGSVELYLPVFGIVYVISHFIKKPKNSFSIIFVVSLIFMFIPILNSSFVLFNTHYYARWFFMPLLIMATMSANMMDEEVFPKIGIILSFVGIILFLIVLFLYSKYTTIHIGNYFIVTVLISLINLIAVYFVSRKDKNNWLKYIVLVFIFVTCIGNSILHQYKRDALTTKQYKEYLKKIDLSKYEGSRFNSINCPPNMSVVQRIPDIHSFNTNISGSAFSFYRSLGINRETSTIITDKNILSILGVNTIINCDNSSLDEYTYVEKIGNYSIYKNEEALPIGIVPNSYISSEEYSQLDYSNRIQLLKDTVVLNEEQISKYSSFIVGGDISSEFIYTDNGFNMAIDSSEEQLVVVQVPFDKGWIAINNNESLSIESVDNGLIGFVVSKGYNDIKFTYIPPYLKIGVIIAILGVFSYGVYILCGWRKK